MAADLYTKAQHCKLTIVLQSKSLLTYYTWIVISSVLKLVVLVDSLGDFPCAAHAFREHH